MALIKYYAQKLISVRIYWAGFVIALLLCSLSGCADQVKYYVPALESKAKGYSVGQKEGSSSGALLPSETGAPIGIVQGGATDDQIYLYMQNHIRLMKAMQASHVLTFLIGDEVQLLLPSSQFFAGKTSRLLPNTEATLNLIADFISSYHKVGVTITGYTDNAGAPNRNIALSRQQALEIAQILWRKGINARMLNVIGRGSSDAIASNSTSAGRAANNRICISLTQIPIY